MSASWPFSQWTPTDWQLFWSAIVGITAIVGVIATALVSNRFMDWLGRKWNFRQLRQLNKILHDEKRDHPHSELLGRLNTVIGKPTPADVNHLCDLYARSDYNVGQEISPEVALWWENCRGKIAMHHEPVWSVGPPLLGPRN